MDLRYGNEGFDLRSAILRLSAMLQKKKIIILKSGIQDCAHVLLASNVKGSFIEQLIASPAWSPILSIESTDREVWTSLLAKFRPLMAKLEWEKKIPQLMQDHLAIATAKITQNPHLILDAEEVSRLVLAIFFELIFDQKIEKADSDLFYQASLEWRKEIALKGKGDLRIKREFWERLTWLLSQHYSEQMALIKSQQEQVVFVSSFAQPFFISPQINFADIFASVGLIFKQQNHHLEKAIERKEDLDYLKGIIFEAMRLHHPFPVLERELTKEVVIQEISYPKGTQVFIMLDEFQQSQVFDPESWVGQKNPFAPLLFGTGPRACPGRQLAEQMLPELLQGFLAIAPKQFAPEANLQFSGRINDRKQPLLATLYQLREMLKFLGRSWSAQIKSKNSSQKIGSHQENSIEHNEK